MSALAAVSIIVMLADASGAGSAAPSRTVEDRAGSPSPAGPAEPDETLNEADRLLDKGQPEAALAIYRQVLDRAPGSVAAHRGAGFALLELERPEEAIPFLQEAVRRDPGAHRAWEKLGLAHSTAHDRIVSELREISFVFETQPPGDDDPRLRRQEELNQELGERDWQEQAIRCLREAARLEPGEAKYWYNLGTALKQYRRDDLTGAAEALSRAAELDPSYYEAQRVLVLTLDRAGRHREAWEVCLQLEGVAPTDDSWLAEEMGDLALELDDLDESERRYMRALELDPERTHSHVGLARLHMRRGDLDRSQEHMEAAIRLRPDLEPNIRRTVENER